MKKSELKSGYKVQLVNGGDYVVLKDVDTQFYGNQSVIFVSPSGFMDGDSYTEDLRHYKSRSYDIKTVHASSLTIMSLNVNDKGTLLYQREAEKEMTIEEIQKELGYKIKVVESKN